MIEKSEGYQKLRAAILGDTKSGWSEKDRLEKLEFAVERAKHYEEKTGIPAGEMLTAWENARRYWYMNYYQNSNQPLIEGDTVRVFDTTEQMLESIGKDGFRCPNCNGVTTDPYECKSGLKVPLLNSGEKLETCNWKVYGLFRSLGKGVYVFVKSELKGEHIFMPIAWEEAAELESAVS